MFGLDPLESIAVRGGFLEEPGLDAIDHPPVCRARIHGVQRDEELADTGVATALADVVPVAGRALLGDTVIHDRTRALVHAVEPLRLAGHMVETMEQAGRAHRTMAPAQVEKVRATRLAVEDLVAAFVPYGDAVEIANSRECDVEESLLARLPVERGKEIRNAGGAV